MVSVFRAAFPTPPFGERCRSDYAADFADDLTLFALNTANHRARAGIRISKKKQGREAQPLLLEVGA